MKPPEKIEQLCKKLKPILGKEAEMLWYFYLAEDEKGRRKLTQDIEILAEKYLCPNPLDEKQILLNPPSEENTKGDIFIGKIDYNNKPKRNLFLQQQDFTKQVGIFAITGEGKTNLAYLMAIQLLKARIPFLVIDWKRSWRNLLSIKNRHPELRNVKVLTIGRDVLPFLWNPFRPPTGADQQQWISTVAEALEKSHLSGPGVAYHFERIYLNLIKGLGKDFYPNFYDGLKTIKDIKVSMRELQWKQTALRIFQSFTVGNSSKVFNARNPIKLEHLLNQTVILELDMEMPKPLRVFISEMILRWIHLFRLHQGETDNLRHVLFLEEAHNLFQKATWLKENTTLENVYREIRAFGQGIVTITQHPSLLPVYLLGNCHTQIYLGLQHEDDIKTARKSLFLKHEEEPFLNQLKVGECIVKIKNRIEPCLVKTPLVPIKKGQVSDEWLKIQDLSSQFWKYVWKNNPTNPNFLSLKERINKILACKTPPRFEVNKGGNSKAQLPKNTLISRPKKQRLFSEKPQNTPVKNKTEKTKYPLDVSPNKLLEDIFLNPFSSVTKRYKRLRLSPDYGNNLKNKLIKQSCIKPRKIITNKGWMILFDLTKKGKLVLRDLGHEVTLSPEGIVHQYWKHRVAEKLKHRGYKIQIEKYFVNGRPDIIAEKGGKKIAVEIETGKSDAIGNIKRAIDAGFDEVWSVATSENSSRKIRNKVELLTNDRVYTMVGEKLVLLIAQKI